MERPAKVAGRVVVNDVVLLGGIWCSCAEDVGVSILGGLTVRADVEGATVWGRNGEEASRSLSSLLDMLAFLFCPHGGFGDLPDKELTFG